MYVKSLKSEGPQAYGFRPYDRPKHKGKCSGKRLDVHGNTYLERSGRRQLPPQT